MGDMQSGENSMKNLEETLLKLNHISQDATIFATKPFSSRSAVRIVNEPIDDIKVFETEGFYYLLEASIIQEVISVWSAWRNNRQPTSAEIVQAIIYYAENDAYQPI